METTATTPYAQCQQPGWEHRLQAVLALLSGEPVPEVTARFGMGRSILYTWRHCALQALRHRCELPCLPKRSAPRRPARRLAPAVK
jgi:transposase-like protein